MLLDRRGGDARPLTNVSGDIGEYAWSRTAGRLALAMDQTDGTLKSPKPIVIDAMHFKHDEDGYLGGARTRHLYLLDVESKRVDALTGDPLSKKTCRRGRRTAGGSCSRALANLTRIKTAAATSTSSRPNRGERTHHRASLCAQQPKTCLEPARYGCRVSARLATKIQRLHAGSSRRGAGGGRRAAGIDRETRSRGEFIHVHRRSDDRRHSGRDRVAIPQVSMPTAGPSSARQASPSRNPVGGRVDLLAGGHTAVLNADDGALAEVYALEGGNLRKAHRSQ